MRQAAVGPRVGKEPEEAVALTKVVADEARDAGCEPRSAARRLRRDARHGRNSGQGDGRISLNKRALRRSLETTILTQAMPTRQDTP